MKTPALTLTPAAAAALAAFAEDTRRLASTCPGFRHSLETLPPVDPRNLPAGAVRALARSRLAVRDTSCGETYYCLTPAGAAACAALGIPLPLSA